MLRFDKTIYLYFVLKSILSVRLSNSLWGSDVLLFYEFVNIEFIILLYTFLVISFAWCEEYMTFLISFSKFSDVLPAFTCAKAIDNHWSICLGVNIFRLEWSETLSKKPVPAIFIGNILLSKALRTLSLTSERLYKFSRTSSFYCFSLYFFGFSCLLKFNISTNKSLWSLSACFRVIVPL